MYQNRIIQSNDFSRRNLIILEAIIGAIKGQMGSYDAYAAKDSIKKEYPKDIIEERIVAILESDLIEGKKISSRNYSISFSGGSVFRLYTRIYDIVLLELLINSKRHSPNINADIKIEFKDDQFLISNNMKEELVIQKSGREGLKLCATICEKLGYILIPNQIENRYLVEIKLP
jgi:hypothetical protein